MRLPVHIWIREENASPAEIAGYFTAIAQRLDERPQKMRLYVESSVSVILDFDPQDGNPTVTVGSGTHRFDIRHRWLPEHPVPLEFGRRTTILLIDPVDGNRFRVRQGRGIAFPQWSYAAFAASATVSVLTLHPAAFAATIAIAAFMLVLSFWARRRVLRKVVQG